MRLSSKIRNFPVACAVRHAVAGRFALEGMPISEAKLRDCGRTIKPLGGGGSPRAAGQALGLIETAAEPISYIKVHEARCPPHRFVLR